MLTFSPGQRRLALRGAVATGLILFALMPTFQRIFGFATFNLVYLYFVFFWVSQATSWNMFSGYSGYFSFGQGAFYGAGVYTTAILVDRFDAGLITTLPLGALIAGIFGVLAGLLVFRLRSLQGEVFALFTLTLGVGFGLVANNFDVIDGGRGIVLNQVAYPTWLGSVTEMLYYLGLLIAVAAVVVAHGIQNSRFGFGLFMIRDDEHVAEALGVPVFRYKLVIFTVSALIAGLSGALHAVQIGFVTPQGTFGIAVPLFVILMSVIGGRRHWAGPIIGAVLIYTLNDRLTDAGLVEVNRIIIGLILIGVMVRLRTGIFPQLQRRPVAPAVVGGIVFVVLTVLGTGGVVTQFLIAAFAAVVVLFVPDRFYQPVAAFVGATPTQSGAPPSVPDDSDPSEDRQEEVIP